ncbi:protoporphyrinogen oxidase [Halosquirtibacter xylanolyticus]|uniref:protoporphyrinogen oxidase n=1 Tax=Halosquirtibacter xylanolyticus TaxID=3374599 RepID=UPI003749FFC5|nr:protoporphyrinogen oxidase [Prolixibacteraceae bacterium]
MDSYEIVILGAGISGLSTAAFLEAQGKNVLILEKRDKVGGVLSSKEIDGYTFDFAANSTVEKYESFQKLLNWTGIKDQLMQANRKASKKYLYRDNQIHALDGPLSYIFTKLLSFKTKLRVLKEPFVKARRDHTDESMHDFVIRRFGKEFLDYTLNPLVAGVYAGDPKDLSMQAAYPEMAAMETQHGSVIMGSYHTMKNKRNAYKQGAFKPSRNIMSFQRGMNQLPKAIAKKLSPQLFLKSEVIEITPSENRYHITYLKDGEKHTIATDKIISTLPAYKLSSLVSDLDHKLSEELDKIFYPPVGTLTLGYHKEQIGRQLDSFGFLVPEKAKLKFLGALWSSTIFDHRAPKDHASFTLYLGGSRNHEEMLQSDLNRWVSEATREFAEIMEIEGEPKTKCFKLYEKAIPQYNLGYMDFKAQLDNFHTHHPNFIISGNFVGGNSVSDCINNAEKNANKMI